MGRFLSIVLLLFLQSVLISGDFVDDINSKDKKYYYGHRVIYEMNIGSFTSQGTFASAIEKLYDIKLLGVDVIWLMPIFKRDGGLNSPYGPYDYYLTNPKYGSNEDLRKFVGVAHYLNMDVWLDWVPNHTSNNSPWRTLHPDYYAKDLHPFYGDVSQLNYDNINLRYEMVYILQYWIDQADIDGYRCDMVSSPYIPRDFWLQLIPSVRNYKGKNIYFLGESDFTDVAHLFGVGFDYDYAWWFQETALQKSIGHGSNSEGLKYLCDRLFYDSRYYNIDRMLYLTNHDVNFNYNKKLSDLYGDNKYPFTVLIFTLYGMPLIYNGQENGGEEILNYFIDSKFDWNKRDYRMYNTIRTLTALKHSVEAFRDGKTFEERGSLTWVKYDNNILAYIRRNGNSQALVVLNLGGWTDAYLSGVPEGGYTQWLDSKTIANGASQKYVYLSSNPVINLDNRGFAVFVKN